MLTLEEIENYFKKETYYVPFYDLDFSLKWLLCKHECTITTISFTYNSNVTPENFMSSTLSKDHIIYAKDSQGNNFGAIKTTKK